MHGNDTDGTGPGRRWSRRAYLGGAVGVGASLALPALGTSASADGTPVRRSIASLRASDPDGVLPTYREAIRKLKALPGDDPRNWANLVYVHGTARRFRLCEHGNWLFLPWHRAYLHYFEEICREVTGNEAFALPYWNWPENPELPGVFRERGDPLYNDSRTNVSTTDRTIAARSALDPVLRDPNFLRAIGGWTGETLDGGPRRLGSGGFEAPAHDYVHIRVGGDMARGNSPNDPSFWTHHGTMDRLWWEWNARGYPNPDDDSWLDHSFGGDFVDRHGNAVEELTVEDVLELPETAYTYDARMKEGATGVDPDTQTATADLDLSVPVERTLGTDVTVRAGDPTGVTAAVDLATVRPYLTGEKEGRVLLTARDIEMPRRESFHVRVYADRSGTGAPTDDPRLAGTLHVWIPPPGHPRQNFYVDLTRTLRERYGAGDLDGTVPIQLVGTPLRGNGGNGASTTVGTLSLSVTQSVIDGEVVENPPRSA